MKLYALLTLVLFLTMLFVPLFSLLDFNHEETAGITIPPNYTTTQAEDKKVQSLSKDDDSTEKDETISVMLSASGKTVDLDMTEYIIGCVAAEMPAEYETEALKAQAVASYTYALYLKKENQADKADISDNPAVHQAYSDRESLKKRWGDKYGEYIKKIEKAVRETENEVLTYKGEIIKPAYHAISPGMTNSAEDVWGGSVPWLVSVTSVGDKLSPRYKSIFQFSEKELVDLIGNNKIKKITLGEAVTAASGFVKKINISGTDFSGEELRSMLSLRSGNFTVKEDNGTYTFTCFGYGHGVGMSQYGANEMAKQGSSYKEILSHYYKGTKTENLQ